MVTYNDIPRDKRGGRKEFAFTGLSSDQKPTGEHEGMKIANGSTFLAMDTMGVSFYDEAGERWTDG